MDLLSKTGAFCFVITNLSFQIVGFRSSDSIQVVFLCSSQQEKLSFRFGPQVEVDGAFKSINFQLFEFHFLDLSFKQGMMSFLCKRFIYVYLGVVTFLP